MASPTFPQGFVLNPDGITSSFQLPTLPADGTLLVMWNGDTLEQGPDYTLSGQTITLSFVPAATDTLMAYYANA
jgi:hypothetical protein